MDRNLYRNLGRTGVGCWLHGGLVYDAPRRQGPCLLRGVSRVVKMGGAFHFRHLRPKLILQGVAQAPEDRGCCRRRRHLNAPRPPIRSHMLAIFLRDRRCWHQWWESLVDVLNCTMGVMLLAAFPSRLGADAWDAAGSNAFPGHCRVRLCQWAFASQALLVLRRKELEAGMQEPVHSPTDRVRDVSQKLGRNDDVVNALCGDPILGDPLQRFRKPLRARLRRHLEHAVNRCCIESWCWLCSQAGRNTPRQRPSQRLVEFRTGLVAASR
mmetsp:Transcript_65639/g.182609  ORF Transcript_65639/g.182609 Transcript_65639/m.182609 type:complete len:268 (-) Transcript_65639:1648-2451(-)